MEVRFRTRKLEREYERSKEASKAYGPQVGRRYVERVNIIKSATSIEQLEKLPAIECHPLKGDRKGQWSVTLTGQMRLIFTLHGENLETARIEEVSKHYGD